MDRFLAVSTFAKVVELGSFARAAERIEAVAKVLAMRLRYSDKELMAMQD